MNKLSLISMIVAMVGLVSSGCSNLMVPKTEIRGVINGKPWSLSSPKDSTLDGLSIAAATNGDVVITIQSMTTRMNPEVITMSGQVFIDSINAIGTQVINGMASGARSIPK